MHFNWLAIIVATLMPMIIGFIYYNPKVLGGVWMKANGISPDNPGTPPKPAMYGLAALLSFFLAVWCSIQFQDPHQTSIDFEGNAHNWITPGHGLAHGLIYGLFVVLPIFGTNAIFEKRSMSYVLVNVGYWTLTLMAVCAIVCAWR